jgi:hypothetical protein
MPAQQRWIIAISAAAEWNPYARREITHLAVQRFEASVAQVQLDRRQYAGLLRSRGNSNARSNTGASGQKPGEKPWPPMGETVATSRAIQWPPMGSFPWPPSKRAQMATRYIEPAPFLRP